MVYEIERISLMKRMGRILCRYEKNGEDTLSILKGSRCLGKVHNYFILYLHVMQRNLNNVFFIMTFFKCIMMI